MAITTNGLQLVRLAGAAFNQQLSASDYSEILASNKTAAELDAWANAAVAAEFRNKTTTDIAKAVLANVGLSSVTGLEAWVAGQLTAGGGVAKAGASLLAMLNDYSNMSTTEAIYGASVVTFNQKVANSQALSQTAGTATGTYAAISNTATAAVFPLTTGADVKTLGSGNDTINALYASATGMTFQATDSLDGGTGSDTINIQVGATGVHAAASMIGVETVSANFSAAGTVSLLNSTGVTTVESSASTQPAAFSNIGSVATALKVSNTAFDATFGFTTAAVAATTDTVALTLSGVTGGTVTLTGVETVGITSSGSANTLTALAATSATTVNVAGDQAVNLGTILNSTVTTLNAGTNTASGTGVTAIMGPATTATITGGTGNDSINISAVLGDVSIATGAGNDTVTVTTNLTTTDTISGGDGTADVLSTTAAVAEGYTAPTTKTITGFERLTLSTIGTAATTLTTANVDTGIATVTLSAGTNGAYGITGPAGTLAVSSATALGGTLTLTDTGSAITDAATLTNSAAAVLDVFASRAVTSTGYETLNINSGSTSTAGAQILGAVTVTVDTGGASAVNFTGANNLTTGAVSATTISASGMTGSATLTLGSATGATSITGTANNDSIGASSVASSVTGGAGNDTITGGTLNDTINGGDGVDSITGGVGKDSLTGGAGVDTFVFTAPTALLVTSSTAAPDVITDFTSGTDKLSTPAVSFNGTFANYATGMASTVASGLANQAFFVSSENNLYVITTANTTTAATDLVVNLAGVTSVAAADLNLGSVGGLTATLTVASSNITTAVVSPATAVSPGSTTGFSDSITSSIANLVGTTLTGGSGTDTLTISDSGTITIPATVTQFETLVLPNSASITNTVALNAAGAFTAITGGTGVDSIAVTNLVAGGAVSLGAGNDALTAMTAALAILTGTTYVGGSDTDSVTFAATQTLVAGSLTNFSTFESVDFGAIGATSVVTLPSTNSLTTLAVSTAAAALTVTATAAQLSALTSLVHTDGTQALNFTVSDTTAGSVNISSLVISGTGNNFDVLTFAGNNNTLTTTAANMAKIAGTVVAGGTGDTLTFTDTAVVPVTTFAAFETIAAATGSTAINISDIASVAVARAYTGNAAANTFTLGTVAAITAAKTVDISTGGSDTILIDGIGTDSAAILTVTGFTTGATASGGDVLNLNATGVGTGDSVVTATGANITATNAIAVGNIAHLYHLAGSAFQVSTGNLASVSDGGSVEVAILAAGLSIGAGVTGNFYVSLDDGVSTAIYRVEGIDSADAGSVLDLASELTVILLATLTGVADNSTFIGANIT